MKVKVTYNNIVNDFWYDHHTGELIRLRGLFHRANELIVCFLLYYGEPPRYNLKLANGYYDLRISNIIYKGGYGLPKTRAYNPANDFNYNPRTGEFFNMHGKRIGTYTKHGVKLTSGRRFFQAAEIAWLLMHKKRVKVEHINGDVYDNRLVNLRETTNEQNSKFLLDRVKGFDGVFEACGLNSTLNSHVRGRYDDNCISRRHAVVRLTDYMRKCAGERQLH